MGAASSCCRRLISACSPRTQLGCIPGASCAPGRAIGRAARALLRRPCQRQRCHPPGSALPAGSGSPVQSSTRQRPLETACMGNAKLASTTATASGMLLGIGTDRPPTPCHLSSSQSGATPPGKGAQRPDWQRRQPWPAAAAGGTRCGEEAAAQLAGGAVAVGGWRALPERAARCGLPAGAQPTV